MTLVEASDHLGGHLVEACVPAFKHDLKRLLDWYEAEVADLPIDVRLNTWVDPDLISDEDPDVTIIATGSHLPDASCPRRRERANVSTEVDLLLGNKTAGDRVVIVGGAD